jgi:hypothetical protein
MQLQEWVCAGSSDSDLFLQKTKNPKPHPNKTDSSLEIPSTWSADWEFGWSSPTLPTYLPACLPALLTYLPKLPTYLLALSASTAHNSMDFIQIPSRGNGFHQGLFQSITCVLRPPIDAQSYSVCVFSHHQFTSQVELQRRITKHKWVFPQFQFVLVCNCS